MGCCRFCFRFISFIILAIAVAIGWVNTTDCPVGTFFWLVHRPMLLGDTIKGKLTPPVPVDLKPVAPPANVISFGLPSGAKMPGSGIGMCCRGTAYHSESVYRTTLWYLLQGGRLIDTADAYVNHQEIGQAVKDAEKWGVERSEIFVTTKIWPSMYGASAHETLDRFLKELNMEYIDLILLHSPVPLTSFILGEDGAYDKLFECKTQLNCWEQTWNALAKGRKAGKVKDIGVSNFNTEHLKELQKFQSVKETGIAVNQIPYNPWVPQWQKDVATYCQANNIRITGYYTLGGDGGAQLASSTEALKKIAAAHNTSTFLVLARWSLQRGVAVIPGTANPHHMSSNIAGVYKFALSDEEMAVLDSFKPDAPEAPMFLAFSPPKDITAQAK